MRLPGRIWSGDRRDKPERIRGQTDAKRLTNSKACVYFVGTAFALGAGGGAGGGGLGAEAAGGAVPGGAAALRDADADVVALGFVLDKPVFGTTRGAVNAEGAIDAEVSGATGAELEGADVAEGAASGFSLDVNDLMVEAMVSL